VAQGELADGTDADQLVFDLVGVMLALNHGLQLQRDRRAPMWARHSLRRLIGPA
jgi:hypothetical protein